MKYHLSIILFLLAINQNIFYAQSFLDSSIVQLDEVVVTATRTETLFLNTPEVIRVLNHSDIELLKPSTVGEVLNLIPGINIEGGTGSGLPKRSIINMNGFPAQYNLVLVDGVRLFSDHIHTGQNIEQIPVSNIERIEIISGASSAQYGSDALGGIVNIITRQSRNIPEYFINFSNGSFNSNNVDLSLNTPFSEKIKNSMFFSYENSDGPNLILPIHRIGKMSYNVSTFMNKLNMSLTPSTNIYGLVNLTYNNNQSADRFYYSYLFSPTIGIEQQISKELELSSRISYTKWKSEQNKELNQLWNPEIILNYHGFEKNTLHVGVDFKENYFTRSAVAEHSQLSYGGFIQDEFQASENLHLMAAVRLDKVESLDFVLSPKFAVLYKPTPNFLCRASIGRGFHAPSVQELYEVGYGHGGSALRFGNENLKPEYSTTATFNNEIYILPNLMFMFGINYSRITNMIVPVYKGAWQVDMTKDVWMRENIHNATIYGFDATTRFRFFRNYDLEVGYSLSRNNNEDTGLQLPYTPGYSINLRLSFAELINKSLLVNGFINIKVARDRSAWNWKPVQSNPEDQNGIITDLKNYEKLDAGITFQIFRHYSIYASIQNLLAQEIETLDDIHTIYKGERVYKVGLKFNL